MPSFKSHSLSLLLSGTYSQHSKHCHVTLSRGEEREPFNDGFLSRGEGKSDSSVHGFLNRSEGKSEFSVHRFLSRSEEKHVFSVHGFRGRSEGKSVFSVHGFLSRSKGKSDFSVHGFFFGVLFFSEFLQCSC